MKPQEVWNSIYKFTLQYIDILFTLLESIISSYQADFQHM